MEEKGSSQKSMQYYMRMIHRVLGYLAVGMVMVYALSGITLIYRTSDFMKYEKHVEKTFSPNMDAEQLNAQLKIRNFKVTNETDETISFTDGEYDKQSGIVTYKKKKTAWPINKFIDLHKLPVAKSTAMAIFTTIFGAILFLLALTSLFMYKPSNKQFATNMIYTRIGVVLTILLLIFA